MSLYIVSKYEALKNSQELKTAVDTWVIWEITALNSLL